MGVLVVLNPLEYWSVGLIVFPLFHYSNTPLLRPARGTSLETSSLYFERSQSLFLYYILEPLLHTPQDIIKDVAVSNSEFLFG